MITVNTFRKIALSFPETVELPHFEKQSFRVNRKIFATLDLNNKRVVVKLSEIDQAVFCLFDKTIIYPVNGSWGKHGWTTIELKKVTKALLIDTLKSSYCNVAPKRLSKKIINR